MREASPERSPNRPVKAGSREDHEADVERILTPEQLAFRRRRQQRLAKRKRPRG